MIPKVKPSLKEIGEIVDQVKITIGPKFLELFSEHLYSSPNKAFEELVSNSWDAGANSVYIGIDSDLTEKDAAIWILDDGESMDASGFHDLWAVANSKKRMTPPSNGRLQIGKFGIGKLATYILSHELTYICKATDGIIRSITMDYREINKNGKNELNIQPLSLDIHVISEIELHNYLHSISDGKIIADLIKAGVTNPITRQMWDDDYGEHTVLSSKIPLNFDHSTWTLALLTALKPEAQRIDSGRISWMLRSTLPLGSKMFISLNGIELPSSKINVEIDKEWILGKGIELESIILPDGSKKKIAEYEMPFPHITIEGIAGLITGKIRLYKDKISGGKSEELGPSNGFFININGRLLNQQDIYWGLDDLNHTTWAKFRATIRADALDDSLAINREKLVGGEPIVILRQFLMTMFNKARNKHDSNQNAGWPNVGEVIMGNWGTVPLEPLKKIIAEGLQDPAMLPIFVQDTGLIDKAIALKEWTEIGKTDPSKYIQDIQFVSEMAPQDPFAVYDLTFRRISINRNHPFTLEHGETNEQKEVLRDTALVDLLTEAYMAHIGIHHSQLVEIRNYRDQTLRLIANARRRSGSQIAKMLIESTKHEKAFEQIIGDALESLGFVVQRLAQTGKPEGLATSPNTPGEDDKRASYSFTYDAKSSIHQKIKTKNAGISGLARHREDFHANYSLVVAPDFEKGALEKEAEQNGVTPIKAEDLARLVMLSSVKGPIDLIKFESIFKFHDPEQVSEWIGNFVEEMNQPRKGLSLDDFFDALESIGYDSPDAITTSVIALKIRERHKSNLPTRKEIAELVYGLSTLVPTLVRVANENVILGGTAEKIRKALMLQLSKVPKEYRYGFDEELSKAKKKQGNNSNKTNSKDSTSHHVQAKLDLDVME